MYPEKETILKDIPSSNYQFSGDMWYVSFHGGKQSPVAFLKELLILISRRRKGDTLAIPLLRRLELADFEASKKQGLFLSETVVPGGYVLRDIYIYTTYIIYYIYVPDIWKFT